jgi:serine/threonine protein kinase
MTAHANGLDDITSLVLARQLSGAIDYLHCQNVVHRDLKTENILVTNRDVGHRLLITDFGLAVQLPSSSGRMNSMVGTAKYVAP